MQIRFTHNEGKGESSMIEVPDDASLVDVIRTRIPGATDDARFLEKYTVRVSNQGVKADTYAEVVLQPFDTVTVSPAKFDGAW